MSGTGGNRQKRAVDLFSGCGGLSLGLIKAGFKVLLASDNDPLAIETYSLNHTNTCLWQRDIQTIEGLEILSELDLKAGELDLLAGCPPCQGFSSIRTLNGSKRVSDDRNDLVSDFGRLAIAIRPRAVLMENVPGLSRDVRLVRLVAKLRRHGYKVRWAILDAAKYGVPQRRRRLILVATLSGVPRIPAEATKQKSVREAIGGLSTAGLSNDPAHNHSENRTRRIQELISRIPKNGGSRRDLGVSNQLKCHQDFGGFNDVYGRMSWDTVAPTITSGFVNPSKGRFIHPSENRCITVREAALLQTFPHNYHFPMTKGKYPVARLIGNAVPPLFAEAQAKSVLQHLEESSLDS